jgi:uncharacterized protein YndB with AHSA1/START domain
MKIDVARQLGAMKREVRSGLHDGKPTRVVVATRSYDTTIEDMWDAITNAERIPRWFLPVSGDLRLDGHYQLKGNAGGTITRCEAPHDLALTWEFGGSTSWVIVHLSADPKGGTLFELQHINPTGGDADAFWDRFGPGAVGVGWDLGLIGLGLHLATGAAVDSQEFAAWSASEDGKSFATRSSDDWRRASIASGTDEAAASAAAARTTAAYTGAADAPDDS